MFASRICSRLETGSTSTFRSASSPETAEAIRSRYASAWSIKARRRCDKGT